MGFKIYFSFLLLPGRRFSKDSEVQETEEPHLSRLRCTWTCFRPWISRLGESFERRNVFLRLGEVGKNYVDRGWTEEVVLKHVHKVFDILKREGLCSFSQIWEGPLPFTSIEYGRNEAMWLLRLGHKRRWGFHLVSRNTELGDLSHQVRSPTTLMLPSVRKPSNTEGTRGPSAQQACSRHPKPTPNMWVKSSQILVPCL